MGCKLIETSHHIRTKNQAHVLEHFWQHAQKKNSSEKHLSWTLFFNNSMRFSYLLNWFNEDKSKASWSGRENLPSTVQNMLQDRQRHHRKSY